MSELEEKTGRIAAMLVREGLDAVVLNAQHNFAWLTGGGRNGVDLSRENGAASLVVTARERRYLVANLIELPRMLAEEVSPDDFEPVGIGWQDEKAPGDTALKTIAKILGRDERIATDIPMFADTRAVEGKIAVCRYSLTPGEIERFKGLGVDAGRALRSVIDKIEPGETEAEIGEKLRHELAIGGMMSVVLLVAADERISKFRHPVPSENRWKKELLLVTCAKRRGLIASLSRIVCVGEVPDHLKRKTEAAAYVNAALLNATQPGATGAELYETAASAYAQCGYADEIRFHHQGGAAGYKTREWVAHPASTEVVQPNQAFAWNPSMTGTKVEETCIVSDTGIDIITRSPDFPEIVSMVNGYEYSSPGVFSI